MLSSKQTTIVHTASCTGVSLHSGRAVSVRLVPADENTGIVFHRVDKGRHIRAHCSSVKDTLLATTLSQDGVRVSTVEHFLSALAAMQIDNLQIDLNSDELPILDGSALPWCLLLTACGARQQKADRHYIAVKKTITIRQNHYYVRLSPVSAGRACHYDVAIDYQHDVVRQTHQRCQFDLFSDNYQKNISRARTFCYLNDVESMQQQYRAMGGSLQNAVVYDQRKVINQEGLRYADEFVRHKVLDAIGDCYINGYTIIGDYSAQGPGHSLNNQLIRRLINDDSAWEWKTVNP